MPNLPTTDTITKPKQWGYEAILDDLLLRLARGPDRQLRITTAPKQADRIQTEQTSEDFLPEFGDVFSRNNFTGGEGLDFAHRAENTDKDSTRYWDSRGIDIGVHVPGVLNSVTLLPDVEQLWAATGTNLHAAVLSGGTLLWSEGSGVYSVASPGGASPSRSSEDPHTGTQDVTALVVLGDEAYAACGTDGIGKRSSGGSWSNLASAVTTTELFAVKSRLLMNNAGAIAEVNQTTGAPGSAIVTLDSGDTVTACIDAGTAILLATGSGVVYSLIDNAGTLELASQTRITDADIVTTMSEAAGVVILATVNNADEEPRIWRAEVGDTQNGYSLVNIQLLKEIDEPAYASVATRDRIYLATREPGATGDAVIWRYQLATDALSRDLTWACTSLGFAQSLVASDGLLFIGVNANGYYRQELSGYRGSGWLISPMADFFAPNDKTWVGLTVQAEDITVEATIDILIATEPEALLDNTSTLWQSVGRISSQDQIGAEIILPAIRGRYAAVQLRFTAGNSGADAPRLVSFALRAYQDSEDIIIQMPVNVSDWIERPNRRPFKSQGWGTKVFNALLGYDGSFITLEIFNPPLLVRGVVESVDNPVIARTERGSATTFALVQIRGRIVGDEQTTESGSGTFGVVLLGVSKLGV